MEIVVLLPAPLTPKNANSSPFFTLKLKSLTALTSPKLLFRCSIFIISNVIILSVLHRLSVILVSPALPLICNIYVSTALLSISDALVSLIYTVYYTFPLSLNF